ncbi:hypothetical protein AB5J72_45890 [Streptomyces sp. CG1]|uniref:hypothetical protein n=1 Tax=Streptomyces sp. CG1 TaxID=1287523 RepID=UPI0034E1AB5B
MLRPAGLFGTSEGSDYRLAPYRLPGRFTARVGLAHALVREAGSEEHLRTCLDVRTTEGTPRLLEMIRKEAFGR